jgi:iron(III) transport system substrate-binding protein
VRQNKEDVMRISLLVAASLCATASLVASAALADPAGKLVLYTSQTPEVAQQTVDAFQAAYPDVTVEWIRNGTGQLMNVIRAEIAAGDPKADVLLVADTINIGALKQEGRLMAYPDAPVGDYDPKFYDPEFYFFGTKIISTGIAYNTNNAEKPDSWNALIAPEAAGKVAVPSPLYSGAALNHLHTVINVGDIGWAFYDGLKKNGITPAGGNGPALNSVAAGQALYGIIVDADTMRAKAAGSPVDFVFPKEGVSFTTEPVAILKTAKNPEAAKAFVDFELSQAGQELIATQGNLPIMASVTAPAGFPPVADIKLLPLDVDKALADDAEVKKHFTEIFGE